MMYVRIAINYAGAAFPRSEPAIASSFWDGGAWEEAAAATCRDAGKLNREAAGWAGRCRPKGPQWLSGTGLGGGGSSRMMMK